MKKMKKLLRLQSQSQVREFREKNESVEYIDWSKAKLATFPNLQPTKSLKRRARSRKGTRTASVPN